MPEENEDKGGLGLAKWIISTIAIAVVGWCVSIEVRMSIWKSDQVQEMSQRVANLETALSPVLIEYGVQQKLAEIKKATPPTAAPPKPEPSKEELARLRENERLKIRTQYPNLAK